MSSKDADDLIGTERRGERKSVLDAVDQVTLRVPLRRESCVQAAAKDDDAVLRFEMNPADRMQTVRKWFGIRSFGHAGGVVQGVALSRYDDGIFGESDYRCGYSPESDWSC